MSEAHISWLAGIWEGEGSIYFGAPRSIVWSISQKDPWLLYKVRDILVEDLNIPEDRIYISLHTKREVYKLGVSIFSHVDTILSSLWVWLSPRRKEQAIHALLGYIEAETSRSRVKVDSELTYSRVTDSFPPILRKVV